MTFIEEINDLMSKCKNLLSDEYKELEQDKMYAMLARWENFENIETDFFNEFDKYKPNNVKSNIIKTSSFNCENEDLVIALENVRAKIVKKANE